MIKASNVVKTKIGSRVRSNHRPRIMSKVVVETVGANPMARNRVEEMDDSLTGSMCEL
jgi:hypothetical protein